MNKYLSIITLNVNGLNAPIKRHRVAAWTRNHDTHIYGLQENHLRTKDVHRLKVKGQTNIPRKFTGKKAGVAILISDKIDFKTKAIKRDKEGHYIMHKKVVHQEDINFVNVPYFAMHNELLCIMCTHIFNPNLQEKESFVLIF